MTIDIDTLIEAYTVLKEYIPSKERQGAADTLMSVMVDMLSDPDIKELASVDNYLKRSYEEYDQEPDDDYDEDR
jgi:cytochrome c553